MRFLPTTHALPVRLSTALTAYIATPASPVPAEVTPLPDAAVLPPDRAGCYAGRTVKLLVKEVRASSTPLASVTTSV